MSYIIVGLGNPGEEYVNTRHNMGRMMLDVFAKQNNFPEFAPDKNLKALISKGSLSSGSNVKGKMSIALVLPETFMNKSGDTVKKIKDLKFKVVGKGKDKMTEVTNLAVVHDDLDIPFGSFKISFNKNSGGHRGVESIIKAVKTAGFVRIRVGISPVTPKGTVKKPHGEEVVNKFILAKFKPAELDELKKLSKKIAEALAAIVTDGREKAMSQQGSV